MYRISVHQDMFSVTVQKLIRINNDILSLIEVRKCNI